MARPKTPNPSPNDRASYAALESMGVRIDPTTGAVTATEDGPFQGTASLSSDPNPFGSEGRVTTTETVNSFDRIDEEVEEEVPPADDAAEPNPEPRRRRDGEQTEEGLAKREADARDAQRVASKLQDKANKAMAEVDRKMADLDAQIQKLSVLQATSGAVPPDLNPASPALVQQYREEYEEAVSVMEAIVAPAFAQLGQLREQVNGIRQSLGEFFTQKKKDEVFGRVYSRIPEAKIKEITTSPAFVEWISDLPKLEQRAYLEAVNNTSAYDADDAIQVFKRFSQDTGVDVGLNGTAAPRQARQTPPMDRAPALRTGSSLPDNPQPPRRQGTLTPLSLEELAAGRDILANGTREEADLYRKRLELTGINVDGREARTFL